MNVVDWLVENKKVVTRNEARRIISGGGLMINDERCIDVATEVNTGDRITVGRKRSNGMKVVLAAEMVIAENLTYKQADDLLTKANACQAMAGYTFYVSSNPDSKGWSLLGRNDELTKKFLADPQSFVIETTDADYNSASGKV